MPEGGPDCTRIQINRASLSMTSLRRKLIRRRKKVHAATPDATTHSNLDVC
jgi:hypothetical protein